MILIPEKEIWVPKLVPVVSASPFYEVFPTGKILIHASKDHLHRIANDYWRAYEWPVGQFDREDYLDLCRADFAPIAHRNFSELFVKEA